MIKEGYILLHGDINFPFVSFLLGCMVLFVFFSFLYVRNYDILVKDKLSFFIKIQLLRYQLKNIYKNFDKKSVSGDKSEIIRCIIHYFYLYNYKLFGSYTLEEIESEYGSGFHQKQRNIFGVYKELYHTRFQKKESSYMEMKKQLQILIDNI